MSATLDPRNELDDSLRLHARISAKINELRRAIEDATRSGAGKERIRQLERELAGVRELQEASGITLAYSQQQAKGAFAAEEAATTRLHQACQQVDGLLQQVERLLRDELPPAIEAVRKTSRPDADNQALSDLTRACRHILQLLEQKKTLATIAEVTHA